jgi:hypothetical protein
MKTIVGLFRNNETALNSASSLNRAGLRANRVTILPCDEPGLARVGQDLGLQLTRYGRSGVLLGILLADSFALALGLSAVLAEPAGWEFLVIVLIAFTGIGAVLGGVLGTLLGVDTMERVTQLCLEGRHHHGILEIVKVSDELATQAADVLDHTGAVAIEIYPELEEHSYHR